MKYLYILIFLICLISNTKAEWEQIHPEISSDKHDTIYHFDDDLRLIAEDSKGNIFVGGTGLFKYDRANRTWVEKHKFEPYYCMTTLKFLDDVIWICGSAYCDGTNLNGTIQYSIDEGKTWKYSYSGASGYVNLDVFTGGKILATGLRKWEKSQINPYLFYSDNYGSSFSDDILYTGNSYTIYSKFFNDSVGFYASFATASRTRDRGRNWEGMYFLNQISSIDFLDSNSIIASTSWNNSPRIEFVRSFDAGRSFEVMDTNKLFSDIYFIDPCVGFGWNNYNDQKNILYKTLDGGKTWINLDTIISGWDVTQIYSEVPGEVWVIGSDSRVFRYTTPLNPPNLISPADSNYISNNTEFFQWEVDNAAQKYQIELSYEPDMSYPFLSLMSDKAEIQIDSIPENKLIFWHVRSFSQTDVSNWSEIRLLSTLDFMEGEKEAIVYKAFPNPCSDDVNIEFLSFSDSEEIYYEVFDSYGDFFKSAYLGNTVYGVNTKKLSTNTLPIGAYFIRLYIGSTKNNIKFVKVE